jgi:hypothetical protein
MLKGSSKATIGELKARMHWKAIVELNRSAK